MRPSVLMMFRYPTQCLALGLSAALLYGQNPPPMTLHAYATLLQIPVLVLSPSLETYAPAQQRPQMSGVIGTWHLLRIDSPESDGASSQAAQPQGMLIYTRDHHASVQLMYPDVALSNEFVHDGYEATFGTFDLDEGKHQLIYHVQGSATRAELVGKSETLHYEFPDGRHMIIRPTKANQHWSVLWERY